MDESDVNRIGRSVEEIKNLIRNTSIGFVCIVIQKYRYDNFKRSVLDKNI